MTAQWEEIIPPPGGVTTPEPEPNPAPHKEVDPPFPRTGESVGDIILAFTASALSLMTATGILYRNARKRKRTR